MKRIFIFFFEIAVFVLILWSNIQEGIKFDDFTGVFVNVVGIVGLFVCVGGVVNELWKIRTSE
ncbi:hypothetical protein IQ283_13430 [Alkalihalobacillus hwajinpoensis]|uniref:hypothetical protein n=1 Tax=Guptibacillus hwajinpoensis TaxID=208199 RepID=UPI00188369EF|nr:hypothetical protein [Pseudalkalibacillus hwajinpoensis]MBF0707593.1 hypothetical protein [Pseudalkalibacillus hwajinpoensis]